eukprot:Skav220651  [mRNA]  locus=scaffold2038:262353:270295:+ [translate_table: standard]
MFPISLVPSRHQAQVCSKGGSEALCVSRQPVSVIDPESRTEKHPLLWDLAWAQCETIYAEVEKNTSPDGDGEILLVNLKREPGLESPRRANSCCDTGNANFMAQKQNEGHDFGPSPSEEVQTSSQHERPADVAPTNARARWMDMDMTR